MLSVGHYCFYFRAHLLNSPQLPLASSLNLMREESAGFYSAGLLNSHCIQTGVVLHTQVDQCKLEACSKLKNDEGYSSVVKLPA